MKLQLGCNDVMMAGYIGVDVVAPKWATPENFAKVDLSNGTILSWYPEGAAVQQIASSTGNHPATPGLGFDQDYPKWPWADSSVDEIVAHDVFEHIQNEDFKGSAGIIYCLNEAHRILKPGGILDMKVPCIDFTPEGAMIGAMGVFCDPTHCQVWTRDTRYYFEEHWNHPRGERGRLGPGMGITAVFKTIGGESYMVTIDDQGNRQPDWIPLVYSPKHPERRKLMLRLQAVKG